MLWLVVGVHAAVSIPFLVPVLDPETVQYYGDWYSLIPVIIASLVAVGRAMGTARSISARRFWAFTALGLGMNLAVSLLYLTDWYHGSTILGDLLVDVLYLLFYFCFVLALRLRPDRADSLSGGPAERVEDVATTVFLTALLTYLVLVPEAVDPGSTNTFIPSMLFYWTVDLFLVVGYVQLFRTSSASRWRATYAWMTLMAAGWAVTDLLEGLGYAGLIGPSPAGSPINVLWYVPYLVLGIAAGLHGTGRPAWLSRPPTTGQERPRPGGRMGIAVLYATVLAVLHLVSNLTGILGTQSGSARDVTVMVFLPLLLGLAFIHQRLLERQAHRSEEARRSLEARQALLIAAVEQSVDAVMVVDLEGRVAYANPACERLSGAGPGDLVGRTVDHVLEPLGDPAATLFRNPPDEGLATAHVRRTTADGTEVEEDLTISPVRSASGVLTHHTLFLRDVTNEARLERQLRQAQRMESLGTMAGGIAHEFNNMLAAILGYSELLVENLDHEPDLRQDLEEIIRAAERARSLTAQILTFSRHTETPRRAIYLGEAVIDALRMIRPTIPSSIDLSVHAEPHTGPILAEEGRIHQVVMNLVGNAVHAVDEKGLVEISVGEVDRRDDGRAETLPPGRYAVLTVSDNGHGMDPQTIRRIYDPFFTTKKMGHGTGLGLSVVHGIVSGQGGAVDVESEEGVGTTFRVYLPSTATPAAEATSRPASSVRTERASHLLVVDDEEAVADVVSRGLERAGFRVTAVTDPAEALRIFLSAPDAVDVLVTDQTMPGITGMDLAAEVHRLRPALPVVLLTGYSDSVTPDRMDAAGVAEVLYKPVNRSDLVAAISGQLGTTRDGSPSA